MEIFRKDKGKKEAHHRDISAIPAGKAELFRTKQEWCKAGNPSLCAER